MHRRAHVGFVFQFYNHIPTPATLESVQLATSISEEPMDAADALTLAGLQEHLHHSPAQLSGGKQQRVVGPRGPLGDGYRIEARIVIRQSDSAVKIPGSSLYRAGEAWRVFAAEDGTARERDIVLGQRNHDEAQILSGLLPCDQARNLRTAGLVVKYCCCSPLAA